MRLRLQRVGPDAPYGWRPTLSHSTLSSMLWINSSLLVALVPQVHSEPQPPSRRRQERRDESVR
jgi:hypothetical protein